MKLAVLIFGVCVALFPALTEAQLVRVVDDDNSFSEVIQRSLNGCLDPAVCVCVCGLCVWPVCVACVCGLLPWALQWIWSGGAGITCAYSGMDKQARGRLTPVSVIHPAS